MNHSHFYEGNVSHCRLEPKVHSFKYSFFWTAIDLDEMQQVFNKHPLWSLERWNVSSFRRKDHLGDPSKPLVQCVKEMIEKTFGYKPVGSVQLITHMAYLGFRFNPVSFYIVRDESGKIEFIVAEINNTPWGEQFCYIIDARNQTSESIISKMKKQFHISPFFSMDIDYKWEFTFTDDQLVIQMENWEYGKKVFSVLMHAKQREMNKKSMTMVLIKYPLMTLQVIWGIYWQAFRLWLKKIPVYYHPKQMKGKTDVSKYSA